MLLPSEIKVLPKVRCYQGPNVTKRVLPHLYPPMTARLTALNGRIGLFLRVLGVAVTDVFSVVVRRVLRALDVVVGGERGLGVSPVGNVRAVRTPCHNTLSDQEHIPGKMLGASGLLCWDMLSSSFTHFAVLRYVWI